MYSFDQAQDFINAIRKDVEMNYPKDDKYVAFAAILQSFIGSVFTNLEVYHPEALKTVVENNRYRLEV